MKSTLALGLGLGIALSACSHSPVSTSESAEQRKLDGVVAAYTEGAKRLDPFMAPYFGVEEDLRKFGDYPSPEFRARGKTLVKTALDGIAGVDPAKLAGDARTTYLLFSEDMRVALRGYDFPRELLGFSQMSNRLHDYLDDSSPELTSFPFDSVKHYDDFVKRSEGFPAYVDRQIETLRRGIREGVTMNCPAAKATPNSYRDGLVADPEKNPFFRPIGIMPKTFSNADRTRIAAEFRKMISERIVPGFRKFDRFFREEYAPRCRRGFGIGGIPRGKEWYAYAIEAATNLKMDPKEIHAIGLREVERITAEMEKVKDQLGFRGSLAAFRQGLLRDPKYFFKSSDEMFAAFEKVKTEVAAKVPSLFRLVPKTDYKIVRSSNPEDAGASYRDPTESMPFGRFIVNTSNLHIVPIYEVTTLSLHESVPGHHFQLALQFEMKDRLPEYRRKLFFSGSFVEGWALYAESLGEEMDLYADPMQRLGHLNDEMLRAVRLVVDTGIHAYGWRREKTVAYMKANLASSEKNIGIEANRYSVWPAQALSYKLGQLKILELRRVAERELGSKFDLKGFHAAVIGNGTVSLPVLDSAVRDWIDRSRERTE